MQVLQGDDVGSFLEDLMSFRDSCYLLFGLPYWYHAARNEVIVKKYYSWLFLCHILPLKNGVNTFFPDANRREQLVPGARSESAHARSTVPPLPEAGADIHISALAVVAAPGPCCQSMCHYLQLTRRLQTSWWWLPSVLIWSPDRSFSGCSVRIQTPGFMCARVKMLSDKSDIKNIARAVQTNSFTTHNPPHHIAEQRSQKTTATLTSSIYGGCSWKPD